MSQSIEDKIEKIIKPFKKTIYHAGEYIYAEDISFVSGCNNGVHFSENLLRRPKWWRLLQEMANRINYNLYCYKNKGIYGNRIDGKKVESKVNTKDGNLIIRFGAGRIKNRQNRTLIHIEAARKVLEIYFQTPAVNKTPYIYVVKHPCYSNDNLYKVGITSDLDRRLDEYQRTIPPNKIDFFTMPLSIKTKYARDIEKLTCLKFKEFDFNGRGMPSEWIKGDIKDIISFIKSEVIKRDGKEIVEKIEKEIKEVRNLFN